MTIENDATSANFETVLARWLILAQELVTTNFVRQYPALVEFVPVLSIDPKGLKYVRIVSDGSAFCFVDKSNGDILKSASWKAPAKGARGNIYAQNPIAGITPYGAEYRR